MSETTVSLQELRRAICRELRMPFFRRVGNFSDADANCTTTKIIDTSLSQKDGTWASSFVYLVATQESSLITAFNRNDNALLLERALSGAPAAGDDYEIHSIWNAEDIHEAINRAIKSSRQSFFITKVDETKCLVEDVLEYDISALTVVPWIINKVYIEYPQATYFTASAGANTTVTAPTGIDLTSVNSTWFVTIYDGTGKGQVRAVTSVAGQVITVPTWTTNPDSTSKMTIFDPRKSAWKPSHNYHLDSLEYPDKLRFSHRLYEYRGGRIRLEYLGVSSELTTEASTTIIPEEYLINKACSILHGQVLNGTKADKESHYAEFKRYQEEADAFLARNAPHSPAIHLHNPDAHMSGYGTSDYYADPLGWRP